MLRLRCGLSFRVLFSFLMELDCINTCRLFKRSTTAKCWNCSGGRWKVSEIKFFLQFKTNFCTGNDKNIFPSMNWKHFEVRKFSWSTRGGQFARDGRTGTRLAILKAPRVVAFIGEAFEPRTIVPQGVRRGGAFRAHPRHDDCWGNICLRCRQF